MMLRNFLCRWFNSALAGRRVVYWVDDKANAKMAEFASSKIAGAGAVLVLVNEVENTGSGIAVYELDGWRVTVERLDAKEQG